MSVIHIVRSHQLGLEAARDEIERVAQRIEEEHGASYEWDGDVLRFSRSGVSGHIEVLPDSIDLTVKLGVLLSAIKGQLEQRLTEKIDEALGKYETEGAVPAGSATDGLGGDGTA